MTQIDPDLEIAAAFLKRLDASEQHTFQVIHDTKKKSRSHILHGMIWDHADELIKYQQEGYGVFVCINATDGQGREAKNITRVRAFAADLDGAPKENIYRFGLMPSATVESSPGKYHAWWFIDQGDEVPLDLYTPTMERLARIIESDHKICDLPRVLRVPGFYHQKGEPFQSRIIEESPRTYELHEIDTELEEVEGKKVVSSHGKSALDDACKKVSNAKPGERNDIMFKQASRIARIVRKGLLAKEEALSALMGAAQIHPEGSGTIREQFERVYEKMPEEKQLEEIILQEGNEAATALRITKLLSERGLIFQRARRLVWPVQDRQKYGNTTPMLQEVTHQVLTHLLADLVAFTKLDGRGNKTKITKLPHELSDQVTQLKVWPDVPYCDGLINTPTMRPNGTLLSEQGYDPLTRFYLDIDAALQMGTIFEKPTKKDAEAAKDLIFSLFDETPFVDDLDRAVLLSAALTVVCRAAFEKCPMFLITANAPGTGKSYLVNTLTTLAQGYSAPVMSFGSTREEVEKRLDGLLLDGVPCFSIDNIEEPTISGPAKLCQIMSEEYVSIRKLGGSDTYRCSPRTTIFATGNGVNFGSDMVRRGLTVRLNARVERPEERSFHHDPSKEALRGRGKYVAAVLTIAKAYLLSGERLKVSQMASFEDWSKFCREPVMWLGFPDPRLCQHESSAKDDYENQKRGFISYLITKFGDQDYFKAADVLRAVDEDMMMNQNDGPVLMDYLRSLCSKNNKDISLISLGRFLSGLEMRIVDGRQVVRSQRDDSQGVKWRISNV